MKYAIIKCLKCRDDFYVREDEYRIDRNREMMKEFVTCPSCSYRIYYNPFSTKGELPRGRMVEIENEDKN